MTVELQTIYRRSPTGRVEAIDVKPDEAEFAVVRWPHAWSLTQTFPPAPPPERGAIVDPAGWTPTQ